MQAQSLSNARLKKLDFQRVIFIDSVAINPNSITLRNAETNALISNEDFEYIPERYSLIFSEIVQLDSIILFYRVLPSLFSGKIYNRQRETTANEGFVIQTSTQSNQFYSEPFFPDEQKLNFSGNFSRGIAFGSNQDLVLTSGFNLQMSGVIADDIHVRAVITDESVPFQPEGNTQQLQDFDKVFIELKKDNHTLVFGDYEANNNHGDLLRFKRKLQGFGYNSKIQLNEVSSLQTSANLAVSRGAFHSVELPLSDGIQGPYQLSGKNNESFIIVLSGSERIFLNGILLIRGEDNDYVIDYNTAEITFTAKRIISTELRIVVEFQYADKSYFRSLMHVSGKYSNKDLSLYLNLYNESDNKKNPVNQLITENEQTKLENIGDDLQNSFVSGIDTAHFSDQQVYYMLIDTTVKGISYDSILVQTFVDQEEIYTSSFTFVGTGNGNYISSMVSTNGRAYTWIAPINGIKQGSYDPVIKLVTPKKHQMVSAGFAYQISDDYQVYSEIAISSKDLNTFSSLDEADDEGQAVKIGWNSKNKLVNSKSSIAKLNGFYQFKSKNFEPVERFRDIEFNRDWNLAENEVTNEHQISFESAFRIIKPLTIEYQVDALLKDSIYKGLSQKAFVRYIDRNSRMIVGSRLLLTKNSNSNSRFIRPHLELFHQFEQFNNWTLGVVFDQEINKRFLQNSQLLSNNSFYNQDYNFIVKNGDSSRVQIQADVQMRYESLPEIHKFEKPGRRIENYHLTGSFNHSREHRLQWDVNYKRILQKDSAEINQRINDFYLGKISYQLNILDGVFKSGLQYDLGSGREQKIQILYQEVESGLGTHAWIDDGDQVKELDEFVISPFSDQNNYVKFVVPTPEYKPVNRTSFSSNIILTPYLKWKNEQGFLKVLSKITSVSNIQFNKKIYLDNSQPMGQLFNPFPVNVADTILVSGLVNANQIFYINKFDPVIGGQASWNYNQTKNLLTSGFEYSTLDHKKLKIRWNTSRVISLESKYEHKSKEYISDFSFSKKYHINSDLIEASISAVINRKLRLSGTYQNSYSINSEQFGGESSKVNSFSALFKYNAISKGIFDGRFSVTKVNYVESELPNNQIKFAMLNGLNNGLNFIWSFSFNRMIAKYMNLSMSYEGRKTGKNNLPVHLSRIQISALF